MARTDVYGTREVVIVLWMLAVMPAGTAVAAIDLLTPPPFSAVSSDHINVVARSSSPSLVLTHEGGQLELSPVQGEFFHGRVPLGFGFNELYLASDDGDSIWLAIVRLPLQAIVRRSRVHYPQYRFHGSEEGRACASCHILRPFSKTPPGDDSHCLSCHPADREWVQPHRPAERGTCGLCHGDDPVPVALPATQGALCQQCHKDKIETFDREYVHGPVAAGSCTACHNPHGSPFQYGLRLEVGQLCTSCHESLDRQLLGKMLHRPFEHGQCTACHDPHATSYTWGLARRSNATCSPCHSLDNAEDWHMHPIAGKPHSKDQSIRLTEQGELECTSCHDPHYSTVPHLLRNASGHDCRGCHEDK